MATPNSMSYHVKYQIILDIYHERCSVFREEEILELGAKSGIDQKNIIDINNALVDDGLVDREIIGEKNYFWSFKAKSLYLLLKNHEKSKRELEQYKVRLVESEAKLAEAKKVLKEEINDYADKLKHLLIIGVELEELVSQISSLKDSDPNILADLQRSLNLALEGVHRWTDNIFQCKSYLVKKRGLSKKEAFKVLKIPEDFDYPEDGRKTLTK